MKRIISCICLLLLGIPGFAQKSIEVENGAISMEGIEFVDSQSVESYIEDEGIILPSAESIGSEMRGFQDPEKTLEELLSAMYMLSMYQQGGSQELQIYEFIAGLRMLGFDFSVSSGTYVDAVQGVTRKVWTLHLSTEVSITAYSLGIPIKSSDSVTDKVKRWISQVTDVEIYQLMVDVKLPNHSNEEPMSLIIRMN